MTVGAAQPSSRSSDATLRCRTWLADRWPPKADPGRWGEGSDDVSVFHALSHDEELALIRRGMAWQAEKYAAGYGAIPWPEAYGGAGLTDEHVRTEAERIARTGDIR